nr:hypothetical protein GCM10020092_059530 [Actinoplanes digitatis]
MVEARRGPSRGTRLLRQGADAVQRRFGLSSRSVAGSAAVGDGVLPLFRNPRAYGAGMPSSDLSWRCLGVPGTGTSVTCVLPGVNLPRAPSLEPLGDPDEQTGDFAEEHEQFVVEKG